MMSATDSSPRKPKPDPWGTPYQYTSEEGASYTVTSAGPDRRLGTEDDIGDSDAPEGGTY